MITKTIHYTWFSEEKLPPIVQRCIASWRKNCPDYKIRHWTMADARAIDNVFFKKHLTIKNGLLQQTSYASMQSIMKVAST